MGAVPFACKHNRALDLRRRSDVAAACVAGRVRL